MLILVLIDVQYSQKAVFSFEKYSNGQNHFPSSHRLVKKYAPPMVKFQIHPHWGDSPLLDAIWKTLYCSVIVSTYRQ